MAEVYWDLEWTLQQQGFDYTYDKRLYDRLREGHARPVREHFHAGLDYQDKLARFLENHDEPRAAATLRARRPRGRGRHHVSRRPGCGSSTRASSRAGGSASRRTWCARRRSPPTQALQQFYDRCWRCSGSRSCAMAQWQPARVRAGLGRQLDVGLLHRLLLGRRRTGERLIVVVNYAANQSQCYVRLPFPDLAGRAVRLKDLTGPASYDREGSDLVSRGLYLDLPPWGYHVFEMTAL